MPKARLVSDLDSCQVVSQLTAAANRVGRELHGTLHVADERLRLPFKFACSIDEKSYSGFFRSISGAIQQI